MYAPLLLRFAAETGIEEGAIRDAESPGDYYLSHTLTAGDLRVLDEETVTALQERFGPAFHLEIGIEGAAPLLAVDHSSRAAGWQKSLQKVKEREPQLALQLLLTIDKGVLLRHMGLAGDSRRRILIFFFRAYLLRLLNGSLQDVERYLFPQPFQRTVILLDDAPFFFQGSLLTVSGTKGAERVVEEQGPIGSRLRERLQQYYATREESLHWNGFDLQRLTPVHFVGRWEGDEDDEIAGALVRQLLHLCILYTANRVSLNDGSYQAVYASPDNITTLSLLDAGDLACRASLLGRLAIWPYSGRGTDRLTFFQNIVARSLVEENPEQNFRAFVRQLGQLLNDARWHNRVFLAGKIDAHFDQVERIADYAAETAAGIAGQLNSMTRGLVEGFLGAVGVIVLTLLGATLNDKSGGLLIRLGMWAYILHLFFFQMAYRLGSIWHSQQLIERDAGERYSSYAAQIGQKRVKQLWQPLARRRAQFRQWFRITVAVYIVVIVVLAALSFYAPAQIAALQATPTPTPAATPAPTP